MNARTQERPASTANSWALAIEETLTCENLAEWIGNLDDERKQSAFWEPIGDQALLFILFGERGTAEQKAAAASDLRNRFVADHTEQIARRETELLEPL